jgi:hypothetical protein
MEVKWGVCGWLLPRTLKLLIQGGEHGKARVSFAFLSFVFVSTLVFSSLATHPIEKSVHTYIDKYNWICLTAVAPCSNLFHPSFNDDMTKFMFHFLFSLVVTRVVFAGPALTTPAPKLRRDDQSFIGWTSVSVYGSSTSCQLKSAYPEDFGASY